MKSFQVRGCSVVGASQRLAWLAGLMLAALLAGCTVTTLQVFGVDALTPGQADYQREMALLNRHAGGDLADADVHRIALRPLPTTPGLMFDLALMTRALAQNLRQDPASLAQTRDAALRRGTNWEAVLFVLTLHAGALRAAGMSSAALEAYAAAEGYLLESARRAGQPAHRSETGRFFLQQRLLAAQQLGDAQLGDRIVSRHLDPLLRDGAVDPSAKLTARLAMFAYRNSMQTARGSAEPLAAHHEMAGFIAAHQAEVSRASGPMGQVARNMLMDLRIQGGHLALRAQRPSLALVQLRLAEADAVGELIKRFAIDELQVAIALFTQDFERTLVLADAMWQRAPGLVKSIGVVRAGHQMGRANLLAALGRWQDAEQELAAITIDPSYLALIDHHAGLTSVVRAMLGRPDPGFAAFAALEPKYRNGGQGIDRSVLYFAARTVVLQRRSLRSASLDDAVRAVAAGRQLGRDLRLQLAAGQTNRSVIAPLFLQTAKEAYLLAALRALGTSGVTMDDVLDAVQLLQTSDIDRDISAAAQRQRSIPGVSADDLRHLQDLQRRVLASQAALGAALVSTDASPAQTQTMAAEAATASTALDRQLSALMQAAPGIRYAFGGAEAFTLREIQSRLAGDEALLAAVPLAESTLILVITGTRVTRHLAPAGRAEIAALVDRVRRSTRISDYAGPPEFDVDAAQQLHRLLLGWGPQVLRGVKSLTIAAGGPLRAVPFGLLLPDDGKQASAGDYRRMPWLIRSVAVAQVPSIASWVALAVGPDQRSGQGFIAWADPDFAGLGVPASASAAALAPGMRTLLRRLPDPDAAGATAGGASPALDPLPSTRLEAQAMARALRASVDADVLLGSAATRRSVIERSASGDLAKRSVVLFATHGIAALQFDGLDQPALVMARDPSDPAGSLLTLDNVLGLRMGADWVILSACNTASADRAGGDPLSGLSRGFFFAGAKALLVTHWAVETYSAVELTTRTVEAYAANPTMSRAQALQRASLALIDAKGTSVQWSHPAYWAPYALVGDGRRRRPGS